jgi:hypothetical protein
MAKKITDDDLALLNELGVDTTPEEVKKYTPKEERIIAGYEEIERFVEENDRLPQHGEDKDIFERLYAVRLDRLRESEECRALLGPMDSRGLLGERVEADHSHENMSDEELLASLGVEAVADDDITRLTHVRSREEIKAAEEIAQRTPCEDFATFKPIFNTVQKELEAGTRQTVKYQDNGTINQGDLFIIDGQKAIVAEMGELYINDYGRQDSRLRVVYDNGTENDLLLRSLQRSLNRDENGRRIVKPDMGLFSDIEDEEDVQTGYIYVLRSDSDDPFIIEHRSIIHKIGVTGGDVKQRIANAKKDPTYLLADVEIVVTYKLSNIKPKKLENLLHRFFESARLNVELKDRFGVPVNPREWFLVPLEVIEEVIDKIIDGTIEQYRYDPDTASLIQF